MSLKMKMIEGGNSEDDDSCMNELRSRERHRERWYWRSRWWSVWVGVFFDTFYVVVKWMRGGDCENRKE